MAAGVTEEVAKAAGGFVDSMRTQPLALALVVMNCFLLGFLWYQGTSTTSARKETVETIINWQKETDKLMASCVSGEVTRTMLDNMQRITETMLKAEQTEIQRMQESLNKERDRSYQLREREADELNQLKKQQRPAPEPNTFRPGTTNPGQPTPQEEQQYHSGKRSELTIKAIQELYQRD